MITSISLTNWRSHEFSRLEFSKGTNLIVGIMGSGKSSVVDALCFALFGNFPALQHRKLKLSEVIHSRPNQEDTAKVAIELEIGGVKYSIMRTIHLDGGSEAEVRKEGKLLEGPQPRRANELIEKLLSIDYDLFTRAIYSEQNNIDYFLELQRGDRKRQMDGLLGIDRFETVRSELVSVINRLKQSAAEKEALVKGADMGKLVQEFERGRNENNEIRKELDALTSSLQSFASKKSSLEKSISSSESRRTEHRRLSEKKAGLSHTTESSCKRLNCKIGDLIEESLSKQAESVRLRLKNQRQEQQVLEAGVSGLTSQTATQRSRLKEIEEKISRKSKLESELRQILEGKTIHDLEKEAASQSSELNNGNETLYRLRAQVNDGLEANTELEKGEGKCPVCEAPLSDERKDELLEKRNSELERIGESMKSLEKELAHKQAHLKKVQERLSKASSLEAKLSEIRIDGAKEDIENSISKSEREKEELLKKTTELRNSISLSEDSLRSFEEKLRLASLAKELSEVERKLSETKFDEKEYEMLRGELESARVSESEARARMNGLEREAHKLEETLESQKGKLSQMESVSKSIALINSSIGQLKIFGNCVTETQGELREELITAINSTMSQVWGSIYPYGDYSELRLSADDRGYELEARIADTWIPVDGVASGGERAAACLSLRIAFAMALAPNLNWLILDEPTHNLDEEAVRSLATALSEKIPEIVEQTFVITHDENLKDAASGSLYRMSRNKDLGESSKVEKL